MTRAARTISLGVLLLLAAVVLRLPDTQFRRPQPAISQRPTATPSATPPALSPQVADRQDRVSSAHRRRETRAFDKRPLLAVLPIELGGVEVSIEGLAADGVATRLLVSVGPRGRPYAEALYRRALAAFGDRGVSYRVRWAP